MRVGALLRRAVTAATVATVAIGAGAATASATELMTQSAIAFESGSGNPAQRDAGYRYAGLIGARYLRALVARDTSTVLSHGDAWWNKLDTFVDTAREKDFQPYLTITYKPDDWGGSAPMTMPTVHEFAYFCRFTAVHFQGRVRDYSVWNEPNGFFLPDGTGGRTKVPAATYGQFYRACRQEIQSVDSSARVYFGELVVGGQLACDYLANAMHSSIVTYTDGLALHPYQTGSPPATRLPENCRGIGRLADWNSQASALAASFKTPAGGQVPLMVTEFGYCTPETTRCRDPPGDRSEANRASWIASAFNVAQANGVSLFNAYGLLKENPVETWRWDVGIVNWDGTPTPSVGALTQATGVLAPAVATADATAILDRSATLNGSVNPNGNRTTYRFDYGTTAAYGRSVPVPAAAVGAGTSAVAVAQQLAGLRPVTTYHYRLVATSRAGETASPDRTFTTMAVDDQPAAVSGFGGSGASTFARDSDGAIRVSTWTGTRQTPWTSLGGEAVSGPAAARRADGTVDVFALWDDGAYHHKTISASGVESGWESIGGSFASAPAAAIRRGNGGYLDVVGRRTDGSIWLRTWDPGARSWSPWNTLGGSFRSAPAIVSFYDGGLDVFARGTDDQIYRKYWNDRTWSGWESLGGNADSGPAATSFYGGNLEVFYRGSDHAVYRKSWDGSSWSSWLHFDAAINSAPAAISETPGQLALFARSGGQIFQRKYVDDAWWPDWLSIGNPSLRMGNP